MLPAKPSSGRGRSKDARVGLESQPVHASDTPPLTRARILLIDDDEKLLGILSQWLKHSGYHVETAPNGIDAIQELRAQAFEIVVLDLQLPDLSGIQLLTVIKELQPSVVTIILSGQGTMDDAIKTLREGRSFDFLRKPLRHLNELNLVIDKALSKQLEDAAARSLQSSPSPATPPDMEPLTDREIAILALVAEGLDNRQIGQRLILSDKTIRNQLSRIYLKLRAANRAQAVIHAQRRGYL